MTALAIAPTSMPHLVHSDILGTLEATEENLLTLPRGVLGFPECRRFLLLASAHDGIYWLQSAEYRALTFVLADPFRHVPEYVVDLGPGLRHELQAEQASDVAIFAIVTLATTPDAAPTMNLQGPLLVNTRLRRGVQHVIAESSWGVATPFTLSAG
ncbi:MAG: flagellar assembly protein FliW [Gemmatimonadaceae bacterium]|jgi:flagellar assembly factor FliW|nr:flagellar assembly protein FliW [Gemmatimonadaceae bacterium]